MTDKDLRVIIDAEAAKFEAGIERARRSTMRLEEQLRKADLAAAELDRELEREAAKGAKQLADAHEKVGRALLGVGTAALIGLGMATKAAIDWESAWAGVTKTVDGSPEQMAELEGELRNLAKTLPATHAEIAGIAEAAGQLGVKRDSIIAFTRTMVDLGETTNLSAEDAATAIAQLGNVMGIDLKNDVDNFGAALVALGNDGSSTEADILAMAQRIGGAGATIGLSTQDVLGFAAALSNVGIEAEAGGSAISKVMIDIASSVAEGGEKLDAFAEVAGVSAADFAESFERDPARAVQSFIDGLGRINSSGENVFATLDGLGLSERLVRDALLRLSASQRGVAADLDLSGKAWEDNTALIEEANKRYDTTAAKMQIAQNNITDLAIDVGGVLLPAFAEFLETGTDLIGWFSDLPAPIKTAVTILGGLAAVAAVAGGGFLLLAPRIAAARTQLDLMAVSAPRAAAGLRAITMVGGIVSLLVGVATAIAAVTSASDKAAPGIGATTEALLKMRDGIDTKIIDDVVDGFERLAKGDLDTSSVDAMSKSIESIDTALASMVSGGNADLAKQTFDELMARLEATGVDTDQLVGKFDAYRDAQAQVRADTKLTAESMPPVNTALEDLATRFGLTGEDAEKAATQMLESWGEAIGEFVSITGAYDAALSTKEEAERETAEKTAAATEDQSDSWEDFMGDVTLTVDEYLAELERMVKNQDDWRGNMIKLAGRVSDEMLAYLAELGPEGAEEVALMAQMTDEELQHAEDLWRQSTASGTQAIVDQLTAAGPDLAAVAASHGAAIADKIRAYMIKNKVGVRDAAKALGIAIEGALPSDVNVPVTVSGPSTSTLDGILTRIRNRIPSWLPIAIQPSYVGRPYSDYGPGHAAGGPVYGPGTSTSDSILTPLSNGEHVLSAAEVRGFGGHAAVQAMRAAARSGVPTVASSTLVSSSASSPSVTAGGQVRVVFDFANAQSDMGRALQKMVRIGELQITTTG